MLITFGAPLELCRRSVLELKGFAIAFVNPMAQDWEIILCSGKHESTVLLVKSPVFTWIFISSGPCLIAPLMF